MQLRVTEKTKEKIKEIQNANKRNSMSDTVRNLIDEEYIRVKRRKNYEEIIQRVNDDD